MLKRLFSIRDEEKTVELTEAVPQAGDYDIDVLRGEEVTRVVHRKYYGDVEPDVYEYFIDNKEECVVKTLVNGKLPEREYGSPVFREAREAIDKVIQELHAKNGHSWMAITIHMSKEREWMCSKSHCNATKTEPFPELEQIS